MTHVIADDAEAVAVAAELAAKPARPPCTRLNASCPAQNSTNCRTPGCWASPVLAPTEAPRVDGFNLVYATTPGTFADFVDPVVPELRSRGRIPAPSGGATLRERLHGAAGCPRIRDDHPAARHGELATREGESAGNTPAFLVSLSNY
ncbi:hypothetical protein ACFV2N_22855 [Streptomyces sp. NPDC059680]|uniref:hypothetical protein n=1 Tax=Streptomyces sp. NPDC059680 TaxID=3346904 RepID=UPI0036C5430D